MQLLHTLRDIFNFLYPLIGIITGFIGLKALYDKKRAEKNEISYELKELKEAFNNHIEQDDMIRQNIEKIEQEQDKQNIVITRLDTKLDVLCKATKKN